MKYSIALTILTLTIFASSIWSKGPVNPVLRFGGDHLIRPGKIIASEGVVFAIEPKMHRIAIFSGAGEFKMNLGRDGEGPGEFKMLRSFNIFSNLIYCYDPMGRRIHLFSQKDKNYLKFISITNTLSGHPPAAMAIHPNGTIIMFNNGLTKKDTLIGVYTPGGKLIKRFFNAYPAYQNRNEFLKDLKASGHLNVDFEKNVGFIDISEGKIYFANIIENKVIEMDMNGKILSRFSIPLPSHEKTLKYIIFSKGPNGTWYDIENQLTCDLRARNNSIYILCRHDNISYIFRLEDGKFREVCRMKEHLTSFDIMNNRIYCLEAEAEDEDDNREILVYNLPEN